MVLLRELTLAALLAFAGGANAFYTKSSDVLMLDEKSFKKEILDSNYASIVEFFAPWCGHCQNLKPAYEKTAKALNGLAKVAAVNCDEEQNKPFCHQAGVTGFPTLKIFRPSGKKGKPDSEVYQGARTAKGMVDAVVERMPNHVIRLKSSELDDFLSKNNETAKAILFTNKGMTTALWKALATDFLGSIKLGQVRNIEKEANERFGITEYPTIVVLPGGDAEGQVYKGKMEKKSLFDFFSKISPPLPKPSKSKTSLSKKSKATSSSKTDSSTKDKKESATPKAEKPKATIPELADHEALKKECLLSKSKPCIIAIANIPDASAENKAGDEAILADLDEVYDKHSRSPFKFFKISAFSPHSEVLVHVLDLPAALPTIVLVNGQRGWFKKYSGEPTVEGISAWVDSVRLGEGKKEKLPEGLVEVEEEDAEVEEEEVKAEEPKEEEQKEEVLAEATEGAKDERHDEL
ncbi:hypothetical protein RUND412_005645 [Rhizina undulata]